MGDPVEFVRNLLSGDRQRVGNRVKKEAFIIDADHYAEGENADVTVDLPAVAGHNWRFDYIHYSYNGQGPGAGTLQITDGVVNYIQTITAAGVGWLPFDSTRWAQGAAVAIILAAGGAGITGRLAVMGARYEDLEGDF